MYFTLFNSQYYYAYTIKSYKKILIIIFEKLKKMKIENWIELSELIIVQLYFINKIKIKPFTALFRIAMNCNELHSASKPFEIYFLL